MDTLKALNGLAASFNDNGDVTAARTLYSECFELQRKHLGDNHPDTLQTAGASLSNLRLLRCSFILPLPNATSIFYILVDIFFCRQPGQHVSRFRRASPRRAPNQTITAWQKDGKSLEIFMKPQ
jgi:hypothetical protein